MINPEMEKHIQQGSLVIEDAERQLRGVMRFVYRDLARLLKESPSDLPKWMARKGRWKIITYPGNPRDAAITLKPNADFEYTKWGISRSPNEFDPPITNLIYLEVVQQLFKQLGG